MEKKLVYSNEKAIGSHSKEIQSLCENLNKAVEAFHASQPFLKLESEDQAFEYVSDPVPYFDNIVIKETKTKRIPGLKIDVSIICQMYNLNRSAFVDSVKRIRLVPAQKHLFTWNDGSFEVNETELQADLEQFRTYAETPEQIEILTHFENLRDILNQHLDKKFISIDLHLVADRLNLVIDKSGRFEFKPEYLAKLIKFGKPNIRY